MRCVQIASAVFIKPPLATCGLTEQQAQARLTGDIDVFVSKFKPMKNTLSGRDEKTLMKLIVKVDTDEVCCSKASALTLVVVVINVCSTSAGQNLHRSCCWVQLVQIKILTSQCCHCQYLAT